MTTTDRRPGTTQTAKARAAALAKIHLGAKRIGLDEADYRSLIRRVGGAASGSAADLDRRGLAAVLARLTELGAVFSRPARAGAKPRVTATRQALVDKIDALLAEAGKSMRYADGIAKRMFRLDGGVAWCDGRQLAAVIAALHQQAVKAGRAKA
jgi:phage gp16-like protein